MDEKKLLYLSPIRNLFEDRTWIGAQIASGAKQAIVGAARDVDMAYGKNQKSSQDRRPGRAPGLEAGGGGEDEYLASNMHERTFEFPISSYTSSLEMSLRRPWSIAVDEENGVVVRPGWCWRIQ